MMWSATNRGWTNFGSIFNIIGQFNRAVVSSDLKSENVYNYSFTQVIVIW